MKRALEEVIIEGVKTTMPFHEQLMNNEVFLSGKYTTNFMNDFVLEEPTRDTSS